VAPVVVFLTYVETTKGVYIPDFVRGQKAAAFLIEKMEAMRHAQYMFQRECLKKCKFSYLSLYVLPSLACSRSCCYLSRCSVVLSVSSLFCFLYLFLVLSPAYMQVLR
jgi:hypothetical protein